MDQIVSITFFHYQGVMQKWRAFANMGLLPRKIAKTPGLSFFKLMGSGKNGFSILPNFSTYGLLGVWDNKQAAVDYFASPLFAKQEKQCVEHQTFYMRAYSARGLWDGQQPFALNGEHDPQKPIAVITRATIKTRHVYNFWKDVPRVNEAIHKEDGCRFSIGIGELPLFRQITFSIWDSVEQMQAFAYKSTFHKDVVVKVRQKGYFKEECFVRFEVVE